MIARDIIVSFCIFSQLKHPRIFGKNLERNTYGVKQSPSPSTLQEGLTHTRSLKFMLVFIFYEIF